MKTEDAHAAMKHTPYAAIEHVPSASRQSVKRVIATYKRIVDLVAAGSLVNALVEHSVKFSLQ